MSEYAPEYTKKECMILVLKIAAWVIPIVLISELWFFDWLSKYAENANCYSYGEINGVHLVFYGLFVFLPLSFAIILFMFEGRRSIKVIRLGQNPLPNEKVLSPTRYKYGVTAKIKPVVTFSMILLLIALSVWGGFQAKELTRNIKPCADNRALQSDA